MPRVRLSVIVIALLIAIAACGVESAGRHPPEEVRGRSNYGRSVFLCERGTLPQEAVWYPPTQVIVIGADAVAANETCFSCPDFMSSGSSDLLEVATETLALDVYIDGAAGRRGVDSLHAMLYPPDTAPRQIEAVSLEADWYRIDVPGEADGWIVRLDLLSELGWESSYAFVVTAS